MTRNEWTLNETAISEWITEISLWIDGMKTALQTGLRLRSNFFLRIQFWDQNFIPVLPISFI